MKWLSTFIILCLCCCTSPEKIPPEIIGINKMKLILWDMINAGELAQIQYNKDSSGSITGRSIEKFQHVLTFYRISKEEFYKSYSYYDYHADKNKILMDSLSAYASRKRITTYKKLHK